MSNQLTPSTLTPARKSILRNIVDRLSLRTVLTIPVVAIIVVTVALISYLAFRNGQSAVNDLASQLHQEVSVDIQSRLDSYLETPQLINQLNLDAIHQTYTTTQNIENLANGFLSQIQHFPSIVSIAYGTEQKEYIGPGRRIFGVDLGMGISGPSTDYTLTGYRLDGQGHQLKVVLSVPNYDPRTRPWYQTAVQAGKPVWTPVFIWSSGDVGLDAVVPVYNPGGQLLGVLNTSLTLNGIGDFLHSIRVAAHGQTFIMDRSGVLVASSTISQPYTIAGNELNRLTAGNSHDSLVQSAAQALNQQFGQLTNINTSQQFHFDLAGEREFAQVTPYQDPYGLDWLIVTIIPESDFMAQINANTQTTTLLSLASLLAAIFLVTWMARWVTRPILRLNQSTQALANGDWNQTVVADRGDELGQLAASFNHMAEQLKASFASVQASEQRYRNLFNSMPVGLYRTTQTGQILDVNQVAMDLLGYSDRPDLAAFNTLDFYINPEDRELWRALLQRDGTVRDFEVQMRRIDGTIRWFRNNARSVQEDGQHELIYEGSLEDITERKRAEEALRESESRLSSLFYASPDAIALTDMHGRVLLCNQRDADLHGYTSPDELIASGKGLLDFIAPEDRARIQDFLAKLLETGQPQRDEFRLLRHDDNSEFPAEISAAIELDTKGMSSGVVGIIHDITERKQAEEALLLERNFSDAVINSLPGIFLVRDLQGIIRWNKNLEIILEYSAEELLHLPLAQAVAEQDRTLIRDKFQTALAGNEVQVEINLLTKSGRTIPYQLTGSRLVAGDQIYVLATGLDITARKRAEAALRDSEERYQRVVANISDALLLDDLAGRVVYANNRFLDLFGLRKADLSNFILEDYVAPEYRATSRDRHNRRIAGENVPELFEFEAVRKDGFRLWLEVRVSKVIEKGALLGTQSIIRDITERKHTQAELERHTRQLSTLNEMARSIIASLDLNEVLKRVIAESLTLVKAEGTSVLLLENDELTFAAVSGVGADGLRGKRIPAGVGVAGHVLRTGHSALIDEGPVPQMIYRDIEQSSGYHTQSLIAAPLKQGTHIIGVMEAVHTRANAFNADDLSILESAANWTAVAISNARQHAELAQRLQESRTLTAISQALNETLDLDRVLRLIAVSARQIIPQAEHTVIHLLDESERVLKPVAFDGLEERGQLDLVVQLGEGVAGQVISKGMVINIADTRQDQSDRPLGLATDLRSLLVAPVQSGPRRLGTISVQSRAANAFSKEAERLIAALGAQAALAIENARLLENTRQALRETDALYRINQGLVALKVDDLLNTVVELLRINFDYYHVQVYVIDSQTGDSILKSASGDIGKRLLENHHRLHAGDGIIGHVADTATPFFTNTVDEVVFFIRNPLLLETKSEMVVPIKIGSQLFGLLDIQQRPPQTFSTRDLQLVNAVADQLAIALQTAKLYEDLQTSLQQEKATRDQLIQSERLTIMGRLLASVSHELGNPLQAIQNALFLLKNEPGLSEQGRQDLETVLSESERMASLVDRLRSTYRPTLADDFKPTQINSIIEDVHALLATHLRHNKVAFEFYPDLRLPLIPALSDQLRQVTLNLFMNAVEAMPGGGVLTASTQLLGDTNEILFTVSDTGIGISESVLPHVFEAFITDKQNGTGLGLAISHEIVMKHHGRISAKNNPDQGATFNIWLPIRHGEISL